MRDTNDPFFGVTGESPTSDGDKRDFALTVDLGGNIPLEAIPLPALMVAEDLNLIDLNSAAIKLINSISSSGHSLRITSLDQILDERSTKRFLGSVKNTSPGIGIEVQLSSAQSAHYVLRYTPLYTDGKRLYLVNLIEAGVSSPHDNLDHRIKRALFSRSRLPAYLTDEGGCLQEASEGFLDIFGMSAGQIRGRSDVIDFEHDVGGDIRQAADEDLEQRGMWSGAVLGRFGSKTAFRARLTIIALNEVLDNGVDVRYLHLLENVVENVEADTIYLPLGNFDLSTGTLNKRGFFQACEEELSEATRLGESIALLLVDLDAIRRIRRDFGHRVSDHFLIEVTRRLRGNVRSEDIVARLDDATFAIVTRAPDATKLAARLVQLYAQPIAFDDLTLHTEVSVGISIYPDDALTQAELLATADCAKYAAKRYGGGRYMRYADCDRELEEIYRIVSLRV